ncbi:MAG: chromosome segregation protein SMC [Verrucomicrobia bacterium]|nr:chromosome segregation protein SMC [Verrucomicrobiota bacterium]
MKKVEFLGFKSFAERTVMSFEPGMTAVVGPNGCGKSNIADAIRWVLGEQSAKALRGGKMLDVIFNGADGVKPTNFAEVTLTLADCEEALKMEYHEVTLTRRLFRSGESQYLLNKQNCRLKDIQRMFMDTGVGRNSYSILEQGKIDQILSSRPEDRRVVFEEASGITKYKNDRNDALRKLDHTEQNLQRLDDVIREVKRRMISLQRQAGKAKRYKEIQDSLRGRDLWLARHKLEIMRERIGELEVKAYNMEKEMTAARAAVESGEEEVTAARADLERADKEIADVMESVVALRNELNQAKQSVKVNRERIEEMKAYASRDSRDAEEARARIDQHRSGLEEIAEQLKEAMALREEAETGLNARQEEVRTLEREAQEHRRVLQERRGRALALEQSQNKLQGQIRDFDQRERGRLVQQERLREEANELENGSGERETRVRDLETTLKTLAEKETAAKTKLAQLTEQQQDQGESIRTRRRELNELDQAVAGLKAKLDVLQAQEAEKEDFPSGARTLLGKETIAGLDRSGVVGALAKHVRADKEAQTALESILRCWMDAVVVQDTSALPEILEALVNAKAGAARILAVNGPEAPAAVDGPGVRLRDKVKCKAALNPLVDRLLSGVFLVEDLRGAGLPGPGQTFVSAAGHLLRGDGLMECYAADQDLGNPLALQARISETEAALQGKSTEAQALREVIEAAQGEESKLQEAIRAAREAVQGLSRDMAGREAELKNVTREWTQGKERLQKVQNQLKVLDETHGASDAERAKLVESLETARAEHEALRDAIETAAKAFDEAEARRNESQQVATDHRIRFAEHKQKVELLERQRHNLGERIREFELTIKERSEGVNTYEQRVLKLDETIRAAQAKIGPLEATLAEKTEILDQSRADRQERGERVQTLEQGLREQRRKIEGLQATHGKMDVDLAERRVRMENLVQRVTESYHISLGDVQKAEEPEWPDGEAPPWDVLEVHVEEMKTKLEQMGPVNMVAIEEFQEQEDRYQFLMAQQEDLLQSKQQLLDTIQKLNQTSTEMFNETFRQVNENFKGMFRQLFGGGEAYLELVDNGDVLESGIDIVAKPPGKKPQVISLLSGGERTMTAVALLFALYMVKPSPFCVLDELDAALDDANIGRFVGVVQAFLKKSQFIVITHNQKTIAAADVLYGVTQQRKGISKVVSVKLTDHDKDPEDVARAKQLVEA